MNLRLRRLICVAFSGTTKRFIVSMLPGADQDLDLPNVWNISCKTDTAKTEIHIPLLIHLEYRQNWKSTKVLKKNIQ